jgi:hypothetical protein
VKLILRRAIAVFFLAVFLLQALSTVVIFTDYFVHREFIASTLCENRNDETLHCNGQCHLRKQLREQEQKEQAPSAPSDEKREIQLFSDSDSEQSVTTVSDAPVVMSPYLNLRSEAHPGGVFHPPVC